MYNTQIHLVANDNHFYKNIRSQGAKLLFLKKLEIIINTMDNHLHSLNSGKHTQLNKQQKTTGVAGKRGKTQKANGWLSLLTTFLLFLLATPLLAQFNGGSGTEANPYLIATKTDLKTLSENNTYWASHFKQTADITFTTADFTSGGAFYNSGQGFIPIGNNSTNFTGSYDGDGHTIDGLYINRPSVSNIGFMGYCYYPAIISNLNFTNVDITGKTKVGIFGTLSQVKEISRCSSSGNINATEYDVGGLIGLSSTTTTISECYSTANISASLYRAGGLIGNMSGSSIVKNCYSTGNVISANRIGGLISDVSANSSSVIVIENCYSTGSVPTAGMYYGGVFSELSTSDNAIIKIKNCFWDTETSGQATSPAGTGLTTAEMQTLNTYMFSGWDFVDETGNGTNDIWDDVTGSYPILAWQAEADGTLNGTYTPPFAQGSGTEADPYLISSLDELKRLSLIEVYWNKHFRQTADLTFLAADFESGGDFYYGGEGFSSIGNEEVPFSGSYNGDGHGINGLYINRPTLSYIGMFGYITDTIKNVTLNNVDITGDERIGGLAGYVTGGINNCHVFGNISGDRYSGGVAGYLEYGIISESSSSCTVHSSGSETGGLVAMCKEGYVEKCYSSGNISSYRYTGGLIGQLSTSSTLKNSYSTASVEGGSQYSGGLVGYNSRSSIENCYSTGSVSGTQYVGGLIGYSNNSSTSNSSVSNCYTVSPITASSDYSAFIGYDNTTWGSISVTNCFYNSSIASASNGLGSGLTTTQMKVYTNFTGFDFIRETANGTDDFWDMDQEGSGYPILSWQEEADNLLFLAPAQGSGTEADPFLITSLSDLVILSRGTEVAKGNYYFKQTADIDASLTQYFDDSDDNGDGNPWNDPADSTSAGNNEGFSPIGINNSNYFRGNYNGDGHTISGLTINRAQQYVGLIGYTNGAVITQLGLDSVNITNAQFYTGGFVGRSEGSSSDSTIISQCYATGTVTTNGSFSYTSGILGSGTYAKITDCYSTAKVTGYQYIGGISGRTRYSTLQNCYAAGPVSGSSSIHSIVGSFSGSSVNNYFNGDVTLNTSTSYSTTNLNSTQMELYSSFANWDFVSETTNGTNDIWDMDQDKAINHGWPILSWQQGADTILINIPFAKGDGTEANPFEIETLEDLAALAADSKLWSFYYKQTADIDASATQYWDDSDDNGDGNPWNDPNDFTSNGNNEGFSPIGIDYTNYFSGNYNGYGHTISGLTINRAQLHVGLFGYTHGTEITQLGLDNVNISNAQTFTGGLVGRSEGSSSDSTIISQCYITGTVTTNGNYDRTGGILGAANNYTKITDCYSTAGVTGYMNIGGITGPMNSSSTIQNCYASGPVNVSVSNYSKPVVYSINGTYSNNYFNGDVTLSTSTSYNVVNLNSTQMELYSSFSGFDFVSQTTDGTDDIWDMDQMRNINSGYPILRWQQGADDVLIDIPFANGDGSELNPFEIATLEDLTALSVNPALWGFNYIQTADIDASATQYFDDSDDDGDGNPYNDANDATTTGDNNGFSPIGISDVPFTGSYNGQGHRISTLTINRPTQNTVGLFGYTTAVIENTSLVNVDITGADYTGALIGNANGDITNCHASGSVSGNSYTGGLTGQFFGEEGNLVTLSQSSSACEVTAESERVGGLIGSSDKVIIEKCFSSGSVTSNSTLANAGGLVGVHVANSENSVIRQSFSSASVTGNTNSGGLLGFCGYGGTIEDCYSTGDVSGNEYIGGLIGYTRSDGTNGAPNITNCYTASPVTGSTNVNAFIGEDLNDDVSLTSCFYNSDVASVSNSLGTGKTTTEMKVYTNLSGFDFARETTDGTDDIWDMDQEETINSGYPIFSWQPGADDILEYLIELAIDSVAPVNTTSATVNVAITKMESSTVSANGLCWNTTGNPTTGNNISTETILSSTDSLQYQLSGLNEGTTYYVRAYATDADLTYYSNEVSFTTFIAQSITFNALSPVTYGDADFDLTASSTSGLDVVYTTNAPDVVSISGSTLTIEGAGTATIYANQPGDAIYGAALEVSQSLTVNKKELTITGAVAQNKIYDAGDTTRITGATLNGVAGTDDVSLDTDTLGVFPQTGVGSNLPVTAILKLAGADTANYSLTQPTGLTASITAKGLTITADDKSREYDGTTFSGFTASYSGFVSGEDETNLSGTLTFSGAATTETGAGTHTITPGGFTSDNYDITFADGSLEITQAPLTITADDQTKVYDGTAVTGFTASYSGFVNSETPGNLGGTLSFSGDATTETGVGSYTITPEGLTSDNYAITFTDGSLEITRATLTITADDQSKVYDGTVFSGFTVTYDGFVNSETQSNLGGSLAFSGDATTEAGVGSYTITPGGLTSDNYNITFTDGSLEITRAPLTITADDQSKEYDGTVFSGFTASYDGFVSGEDETSLSGSLSFSGDATTETGAGSYTISPEGFTSDNYDITFTDGSLEITRAELTITADNQTKVYDGTAFSGFTANYSGFVSGETQSNLSGSLTFSGAATTETGAGPHTITPGGFTSDNYDITFTDGSLEITRAALTITADDQSKVYDGDLFSPFTASYSGFVNGENQSNLSGSLTFSGSATTETGAGTHTITPGGFTSDNYDITFTDGSLEITPAALTITAEDQSKVYDGELFSPFTASYSGFVNGETQSNLSGSLTFSGSATTETGAGTHTITPGGLTSDNYDITFTDGSLKITRATLTITADNQTKVYDGTVFSGFTVTYDGFVNSENQSNLSGSLTFSGDATTQTGVGPHTITPGGFTSDNYDITFADGSLEITPAVLTITAEDQIKVYDGTVFSGFTVTYDGFVNSETQSNLSGSLAFSGDATTETGAGTHTITPGGLTSDNYDITFTDGSLKITRAGLTITAEDKSKEYDGELFSPFTVTYSGFVPGEDENNLSGALVFSGTAATATGSGQYVITPSGLGSDNYLITFENGTLEIIGKPLTVVNAVARSKVYDATDVALITGAMLSGLAAGDVVTLENATSGTFAQATVGTEIAVSTNMLISGPDAPNYSLEQPSGLTADITKKELALTGTFSVEDKTYDGSTTASFSGNNITLTGVAGTDDVAPTGAIPLFETATAGSNIRVSISGTTLTGDDAGNYTLSHLGAPTTTADIRQKEIPLSGAAGVTKPYSGNAMLPQGKTGHSGLSGILPADQTAVTLTGAALFDGAEAGAHTIVKGDLALTGTKAGNYRLVWTNGTGTITRVALSVQVNNDTKFVTGSDTPGYKGVSITGFTGGETEAILNTEAMEITRTNAGTESAGEYPGVLEASGLAAENYSFTYLPGDYSILPADELAVTITPLSVTYGEARQYTIASARYLDSGDNTIADLTGNITAEGDNTFSVSDGSGGSVSFTVTEISPLFNQSGELLAAGTYQLEPSSVTGESQNFSNNIHLTGSLTVHTKAVDVSLAEGSNQKDFDGDAGMDNLQAQAAGFISGDDVTLESSGFFSQSKAGTGLPYKVAISLSGADKTNYHLAPPSPLTGTDGEIGTIELTVTGTQAENKTYDATEVAILTGATLSGAVSGDDVALSGTGSGTFAQAAAGTNIPVTTKMLLIGSDAGNYTLAQPRGLTADIAQRELSVTGTTALDKVYDATSVATLTGAVLTGVITGDDVSLSGEVAGTFDRASTGQDIPVTTGMALTGEDAPSYTLIQPQGLTADITGKELFISGSFSVRDKTYDATTTAQFEDNNLLLAGVQQEDQVMADAFLPVFASPGAGDNVEVTLEATLSGADAGNYTLSLAGAPTARANIIPVQVILSGMTGVTKTYDGTTQMPQGVSGYGSLSGVLPVDETMVVLSGAPQLEGPGAGAHAIIKGSLALTGSRADNYLLDWTDGTATVEKAQLQVTVTNATKFVTQEDTPGYNGVTITGFINGETEAVVNTGALLIARTNSGTESSGEYPGVLEASGLAADNYSFSYLPGDYSIVPADELMVQVAKTTITYGEEPQYIIASARYLDSNGSAIEDLTANVTGEGNNTFLVSDGAGGSVSFTVTGISPLYNQSGNLHAAGSYQLQPSSVTGSSGNFSGNIHLTGSLTVNTKAVDVSLAEGSKQKDFGGDAGMDHLQAQAAGFIPGDDVTLESSGSFSQSDAGTGLPYSVAIFLSGADKANYHLATPSPLTGTDGEIGTIELTVTGAQAESKIYDATNVATLTGAILSGAVTGDDVILSGSSTGTFEQLAAGAGIPVTTAMVLSGSDASNYTLAQPQGLMADITPKPLTVTGTVAQNKVYDATDTAILTGATLLGALPGDDVALSGYDTGLFDLPSTGNGIPVTTSMVLSGSDAPNYTLAQPQGLMANITPKALTVQGAMAENKTYDGTTGAVISGALLSGVATGDVVTLEGAATGTFEQATTGQDILVTTTMTITGISAENYSITQPAGLMADITQKELTLSGTFAAENKTYDATTAAALLSHELLLNGLVPGDVVQLQNIQVTFDVPQAGSRQVMITDSELSGPQASRYTLSLDGAPEVMATIEKKQLSVTADNQEKKQGEENPPLTLSYDGFAEGETADVIDTPPVAVTGVDINTLTGAYPGAIIPQGGQDDNYSFIYIPGDFTVTDPVTDVYIQIGNLQQVYSGMPGVVTVTTTPAGIAVVVTYNGNRQAPVEPGTYDVTALVNQNGYRGSKNAILHILADTDLDGVPDTEDTDDDNDGVPDDLDAFPQNSGETADSDGDGVGDNSDPYPLDSEKSFDTTAPVVFCNPLTLFVNPGESYALTQADIDKIAMGNETSGYTSDDVTPASMLQASLDVEGLSGDDTGKQLPVTVAVADTAGNTAFCSTFITVGENHPPVVSPQAPDSIVVKKDSTSLILLDDLFSEDDPGQQLTYSLSVVSSPQQAQQGKALATEGELPSWVHFDNETNSLELTPSQQDVGTYLFTITAKDPAGMTATMEMVVTVSLATASAEIAQKVSMLVYPIPASDKIFVRVNGITGPAVLAIQNIAGNRVLEKECFLTGETMPLEVYNLADGIYFISMKTQNKTMTQKILVKH